MVRSGPITDALTFSTGRCAAAAGCGGRAAGGKAGGMAGAVAGKLIGPLSVAVLFVVKLESMDTYSPGGAFGSGPPHAGRTSYLPIR